MAFAFEKSGQLKAMTAEELAEADKRGPMIVRDQGTYSDGTPYWLYIAVVPSRYNEFMRLLKERNPLIFEDYGTILKEGHEAEIPESIQKEMVKKYGFDENFTQGIRTKVKTAQQEFLKDQQEKEDRRISAIVGMLKKTP